MEQRYNIDYKAIGQRIKKARKAIGITQGQLAELAYVTTNYIAKLETNRTACSLETMTNICNALKTDINMLILGEAEFPEHTAVDLLITNQLAEFSPREKEALLLIINAMKVCKNTD